MLDLGSMILMNMGHSWLTKTREALFLLTAIVASQACFSRAVTLEGKTLTLTVQDEAVLIDGIEEEARAFDRYAWNFKRVDGHGMAALQALKDNERSEEQLMLIAQEQLELEKKRYAEIGFDKGRTWSPVAPVQFRNPGWKGVGWRIDSVLKLKSGEIKDSEYRMVLWGGGKAWVCVYLGGDAHSKFMKVLESAVFKQVAGADETEFVVELPPQQMRTWTNVFGRSFDGKLVSATVGGVYVSIERSDGRVFNKIPVNTFSQNDQEHLKALIKASTKEVRKENLKSR